MYLNTCEPCGTNLNRINQHQNKKMTPIQLQWLNRSLLRHKPKMKKDKLISKSKRHRLSWLNRFLQHSQSKTPAFRCLLPKQLKKKRADKPAKLVKVRTIFNQRSRVYQQPLVSTRRLDCLKAAKSQAEFQISKNGMLFKWLQMWLISLNSHRRTDRARVQEGCRTKTP